MVLPRTLTSELATLFLSGDPSLALTKALAGGLSQSSLRSLCWKVFLEYLPVKEPEKWIATIRNQREVYEKLKQQHLVNPSEQVKEKTDLKKYNPLSMDEDNPWNEFFSQSDLEKEIQKDLERLFPEHPYFEQDRVKETMLTILTVWAREHEDISYRQGMHEILAPIFFVLDSEKLSAAELGETNGDSKTDAVDKAPANAAEAKKMQSFAEHEICELFAEDYIEHDAFHLFSRIMQQTAHDFAPGDRPTLSGPANPNTVRQQQIEQPSAIQRTCRRIQEDLLAKFDPMLYRHLKQLHIEPQIYALKWVRLMLGREFHFDDVLILWDAIFAEGVNLKMIEYLCVAMLMYIRESLLSSNDYAFVLKRLLKYPPVEDVYVLVHRALQLKNPRSPLGLPPRVAETMPPESRPAPPVPLQDGARAADAAATVAARPSAPAQTRDFRGPVGPGAPGSHQSRPHNRQSPHRATRPAGGVTHIVGGVENRSAPQRRSGGLAAAHARLQRDHRDLQQRCSVASTRIDTLVEALESACQDNASLSDDRVQLAMAQLKEVRDSLRGVVVLESSPSPSDERGSSEDSSTSSARGVPDEPVVASTERVETPSSPHNDQSAESNASSAVDEAFRDPSQVQALD